MGKEWLSVRGERLKFLLWTLRHPRQFLTYGSYARDTGMHLSTEDKFGVRKCTICRVPADRAHLESHYAVLYD